MKKLGYVLLALATCALKGEKYVLNEVRAIVHGPTQNSLILTLDLKQGLDGQQRTLRDLIMEQLMIFDAKKLNMEVSDDEVDKYLKQLQKSQGYTPKQIEEFLQGLGYTMAEGRELFKTRDLIERLIEYRVRSSPRMVVTPAEIEEHWLHYAPLQEGSVTIAEAFVKSNLPLHEFEKSLKKDILREPIQWRDSFTIKSSQLPSDKKFVLDRKAGDIVLIERLKDGYEITKLVAKVDECYMPLKTGDEEADKRRSFEIEQRLKSERFKEVLYNYERSLLAQARVDFTYEDDRKAVFGE